MNILKEFIKRNSLKKEDKNNKNQIKENSLKEKPRIIKLKKKRIL